MRLADTLKVTPSAYLLWNGVPFEELGLMEHLESASFTITVKKGGKSHHKKVKAAYLAGGDPRVGAATLKFILTSRVVARKLRQLLLVDRRPVISMAAAHDDNPSDVYWLGSYKIDSSEWSYGENSVNTLTLSGLTDKVVGMAETTKPRIWHATKVRDILTQIAGEHGLELDTDLPDSVLNTRVDYNSTNDEDDWSCVSRLAETVGAASMYVRDEPVRIQRLEQSRLVEEGLYKAGRRTGSLLGDELADVGSDSEAFRRRAAQVNAKRFLRLSRAPGFVDLSSKKQRPQRIYTLGYAPGMDDPDAADVLIQSVQIKESGYRSDPKVSGGQVDLTAEIPIAWASPRTEEGGTSPVGSQTYATFVQVVLGKGKRTAAPVVPDPQRSPEATYQLALAPAPAEIGSLPTSEKMRAVALNQRFVIELTVRLSPGLPFLRPPALARVVGTDAHDGEYGIEEHALDVDGSSGIVSRLTLRPVKDEASKVTKRDALEVTFNIAIPTEAAIVGQSPTRLGDDAVKAVPVQVILRAPPPPPRSGSSRGISQVEESE